MLQKNALVKARKHIESLYDDTCDVIEFQEYKKANRATDFHEVTVL